MMVVVPGANKVTCVGRSQTSASSRDRMAARCRHVRCGREGYYTERLACLPPYLFFFSFFFFFAAKQSQQKKGRIESNRIGVAWLVSAVAR